MLTRIFQIAVDEHDFQRIYSQRMGPIMKRIACLTEKLGKGFIAPQHELIVLPQEQLSVIYSSPDNVC
jgi:hypothetical protein